MKSHIGFGFLWRRRCESFLKGLGFEPLLVFISLRIHLDYINKDSILDNQSSPAKDTQLCF